MHHNHASNKNSSGQNLFFSCWRDSHSQLGVVQSFALRITLVFVHPAYFRGGFCMVTCLHFARNAGAQKAARTAPEPGIWSKQGCIKKWHSCLWHSLTPQAMVNFVLLSYSLQDQILQMSSGHSQISRPVWADKRRWGPLCTRRLTDTGGLGCINQQP